MKKKQENFKINRIIYLSNFDYKIDRIYKKVLDTTSPFDAQIDLVYIDTPEFFSDTKTTLEKINTFCNLQPYDKVNLNIFNDYNSINGVLNFSKQIDADIIAMSTLGKTGATDFWNMVLLKTLSIFQIFQS